jgi:WS/DGAT/MGAT family acyltransferase
MEQLTEMDYSFVQMESSRTPMHITPVMFYDQSGVKGGQVRFKDILRVFERNLHKSAVFRRKLGGRTMGFDTPYWVEDPDFDLEFHVRHIALPKPGDWRQLCILLARLHARGLDMRRPLWEAYVIEGLNDVEGLPPKSFAIMLKVHHAAIDGVSAAEILNAIHSLTDEREPPLVEDNWRGEAEPSALQVWPRAYWNNVRRPIKLIEAVSDLLPSMLRANRQAAEEDKGESFSTLFNHPVSAYRVTDSLIVDLQQVKDVRKSVEGVTVNDVIVSVVGGGLRKYLRAKDALPAGSLVAAAPINVRAERNSDSRGNQVGAMSISLATDVEDPVERLRAVQRSARESKEYASAVGARTMMELSQGLWPQVIGAGFKLATLAARTAGDFPMPMHTVVSNVPGPQVPLYLAGARLHLLTGMGPLTDMMGLFHGVISGVGKISINFVSCRELMPDPQFYRQCLQEAWDELEAATRPKAATRSKAATKRRASKRRSA